MYNKIISLLFLLVLIASPTFACGDMEDPPTVILQYVVEKITNDQFYGSWNDGSTIHFSRDDIVTEDDIFVGDTVLATFERDNLVDVVSVEFFNRDND
ncbi:hypothetical protein [Ammoniphilus sp. 3BR4]|uniref:hypothetical protein n=1 Tax=Ammoniphilus sp. 3BR4 TaxID=3158265 RepID=UPI0034657027